MMVNFKAAFKKPIIKYSVIGIVAVGIIWVLMKRGGGSNDGVQYAALMAQANAQQSAIASQANAQMSSDSAALAAHADDATTAYNIAKLNSFTQLGLADKNIAGSLSALRTQASSAQDIAATNAAGTIQLAKINAANGVAQIIGAQNLFDTKAFNDRVGIESNERIAADQLSTNYLMSLGDQNSIQQRIAAAQNVSLAQISADKEIALQKIANPPPVQPQQPIIYNTYNSSNGGSGGSGGGGSSGGSDMFSSDNWASYAAIVAAFI